MDTPSSRLENAQISWRSFSNGDIILFFPIPANAKDFLSFNLGYPHHYLSPESIQLIGKDKYFKKSYVLGRMSNKANCVATAEINPFKLPIGTNYYLITVTSATQE